MRVKRVIATSLQHYLHVKRLHFPGILNGIILFPEKFIIDHFICCSILQTRKLTEAQQAVGPLRQKNRQFIARNLELSAKNRELSQSIGQPEENAKDDGSRSSRSSRSSSSNRKLRARISASVKVNN